MTGVAKVSLTGGTENMSQAPYIARNIRFGNPLGVSPVLEDSLWLGLTDTYCKLPMALTAEKLGAQYKLTRDEVDEFALRSQKLWKAGNLKHHSLHPLYYKCFFAFLFKLFGYFCN